MNPVLEKILETSLVDDGEVNLSVAENMDADEGVLIDRAFREARPDVSVEVGFAYGVSTLFACEALAANGKAATHIVIDPAQNGKWRGIGLKNVERAGYRHLIDFREERSEIALPSLLASGMRVQAAIIDGWHVFDHALVDFFYVNKMLDVGGIVILDDTDWPSVSRLVGHIASYPAYELFATTARPELRKRIRTRARQALAKRHPEFRRFWEYPTCMAFRKVAEDQRDWDWHVDF